VAEAARIVDQHEADDLEPVEGRVPVDVAHAGIGDLPEEDEPRLERPSCAGTFGIVGQAPRPAAELQAADRGVVGIVARDRRRDRCDGVELGRMPGGRIRHPEEREAVAGIEQVGGMRPARADRGERQHVMRVEERGDAVR